MWSNLETYEQAVTWLDSKWTVSNVTATCLQYHLVALMLLLLSPPPAPAPPPPPPPQPQPPPPPPPP